MLVTELNFYDIAVTKTRIYGASIERDDAFIDEWLKRFFPIFSILCRELFSVLIKVTMSPRTMPVTTYDSLTRDARTIMPC